MPAARTRTIQLPLPERRAAARSAGAAAACAQRRPAASYRPPRPFPCPACGGAVAQGEGGALCVVCGWHRPSP